MTASKSKAVKRLTVEVIKDIDLYVLITAQSTILYFKFTFLHFSAANSNYFHCSRRYY